jgi:hypothetical protein
MTDDGEQDTRRCWSARLFHSPLQARSRATSSLERHLPLHFYVVDVNQCSTMPHLFPSPSVDLEPFTSLLLRGRLPPSTAIHLCLSHLSEQPSGRVVLITPSRKAILDAFKEADDVWLHGQVGAAASSLLAARTHMLYVIHIAD